MRNLVGRAFLLGLVVLMHACGGGGPTPPTVAEPPPTAPVPPPPPTPQAPAAPVPGLMQLVAGKPGEDMSSAGGANLTASVWHLPRGIAIANDGTVYIADEGSNTIRKIQAGVISRFAGNPGSVCGLIDGPRLQARFCQPRALTLDAQGNLYVGDVGHSAVRKITTSGQVTTVALVGTRAAAGAANAPQEIKGLAASNDGTLYVAVCSIAFSGIYQISPSGSMAVFAGGSPAPYTGAADGQGSGASFLCPQGIALASSGDLYVADAGGRSDGGVAWVQRARYNAIRRISAAGVVTTVAGAYDWNGQIDGPSGNARFESPNDLAFDAQGNLYITDETALRRLGSDGIVTTLTGALPNASDGYCKSGPSGNCSPVNDAHVAVGADGTVLVTEIGRHTIRQWNTSTGLSTYAGVERFCCNADGAGSGARFDSEPLGLAATAFGLIIGDGGGLRRIDSSGVVSTMAMSNLIGVYPYDYVPTALADWDSIDRARIWYGRSIAADSVGALVWSVTDRFGEAGLHRLTAATGLTQRIGATARAAVALLPSPSGTTYAILEGKNAIFRTDAAGIFQPWVGKADGACGASDGTGEQADFCSPSALALDAAGDIMVADTGNHTIRRITGTGKVMTLAGQPGSQGSADGLAGRARFFSPGALASDPSGNVYVADTGNFTIRKVAADGNTVTVAGTPGKRGMPAQGEVASVLPPIDALALVGKDLYFAARGRPVEGCTIGCTVNNGVGVIRNTP